MWIYYTYHTCVGVNTLYVVKWGRSSTMYGSPTGCGLVNLIGIKSFGYNYITTLYNCRLLTSGFNCVTEKMSSKSVTFDISGGSGQGGGFFQIYLF